MAKRELPKLMAGVLNVGVEVNGGGARQSGDAATLKRLDSVADSDAIALE